MSQSQVAATAGVSRSLVSMIERGVLDGTSLRLVRRVAAAVGVSLPIDPRWRGADLATLLDERHAVLVQVVVAKLIAAGWQALPEHTFNEWGEKGSIDVLAWQGASRALLSVEIKTRLPDLQDLLSTMDRKRRLAPTLARRVGWRPIACASVLVLPDETWARNAVARFGPVLAAALPERTVEVRRWLRQPDRDLRGIWFLLNDIRGSARRRPGGSMRIRPRKPWRDSGLSRSERSHSPGQRAATAGYENGPST